MSADFANSLGSSISGLQGLDIKEALGHSDELSLTSLLEDQKTTRFDLNGRSLYWTNQKLANGGALAGYFVGTLYSGDLVDDLEPRSPQRDNLPLEGESAQMIAHDAVGHLNAIANNAELLLSFYEIDDEAEVSLTAIREEALRAGLLLQNLLKTKDNSTLVMEPVEIADVVQESVRLLKHQDRCRGVRFHIEKPTKLPLVLGDPSQLNRVFSNLIGNAIDASDSNERVVIRVNEGILRKGEPAVQITVADSGSGINTKDLQRVFEPFFSTKQSNKGSGLGLCIAKRIVELHRGELTLESSKGVGTTATVLLPMFRSFGA
jgi:signal transduction histidine kinase